MKHTKILVINCGSSSLKYQLLLMPEGITLMKGNVERIGEKEAFIKQKVVETSKESKKLGTDIGGIPDHKKAFKLVVEGLIDKEFGCLEKMEEIEVVAHRVVHGGEKYSDSVIVTDEVLKDIEAFSDLAPLHNPANLMGIKSAMEILPNVPQTATFDTAFHQTIPDYAYTYALPYEFYEKYKIRRYGFHGTSHKYVANKSLEICKRSKDNTNIISCHLGNGCSITAINNGKSVDTSMGFTPLEGLVMGTRSGDIDPAIIQFLSTKGYTIDEINNILNKKSGVLGIYQKTNDMRDIEDAYLEGDKMAKLALDVFSYRVKKYIGAYCAIMVKVDILLFTGGVGENSPVMREMICNQLENIGIHIDSEKNTLVGRRMGVISKEYSPVTILAVPTDEERQMANDAYDLLHK